MSAGEIKKILIADDETSITEGLSAMLEMEGYATGAENDGLSCWKRLTTESFELLLVDLMMPGMTGLELLQKIRSENRPIEVIIVTGQGSIDTAVSAMREGAYDYLTKPVDPKRIRSIVPKALERQELAARNKALAEQNLQLERTIKKLSRFEDMVGRDDKILKVFEIVRAVADTTANVFITGESGTGKELVARAIHNRSSRAKGSFFAINCSAFPREILENELFGHEKGAFTGAIKEKCGYFEMAHGGTLFLDEIGEMPPDTQAKLLRVIEERKFRRLGGTKEIEVDIRLVSATNRDIQQAMSEGALREDLYYRLGVMDIQLPPLRERMGDLLMIMTEFLDFFNKKNGKQIRGFSKQCMDVLQRYYWPGNIRELRNVVERAVILCNSDFIQLEHLPTHFSSPNREKHHSEDSVGLGRPLHEIEKEVIYKTLEQVNNNKTKAAQALGISLKTMHNKLNKYMIDTD